jgi:hypothetical protein
MEFTLNKGASEVVEGFSTVGKLGDQWVTYPKN